MLQRRRSIPESKMLETTSKILTAPTHKRGDAMTHSILSRCWEQTGQRRSWAQQTSKYMQR